MPSAHPVAASSLAVARARSWRPMRRRKKRASGSSNMNRAVEELNYRGTFVHVLDGTAETLHIVHRNADGQSGERILSLGRRRGARSFARATRCSAFFRIGASCCSRTRKRREPARVRPAELHGRARAALRAHARRERARRRPRRADARDQAARRVPLRLHAVARSRDGDAAAVAAHRRARVRSSSRFCSPTSRFPPIIPAAALAATIDTTGFTTLRAARVGAARGRRFRGARPPCPAGSSCRSRRKARSQAPTRPSSISSIPTVSRRCRCSSRIRRRRPRSAKASRRSAARTRTR